MQLTTLSTRVATTLAALLTALAVSAPVAARACDDAPAPPPARLAYADLAHSAEMTAAGVPSSTRSVHRGTGDLLGDPHLSYTGGRPLALLLPDQHGKVFWQEAQTPDQKGFLGQELTEATSFAAAHDLGMALYEQVRSDSGHARHAIPVNGGSLTWFHEDNQGPGVTVSVIRMGRRVSVVVVNADVAHRDRLLVAIAGRMR